MLDRAGRLRARSVPTGDQRTSLNLAQTRPTPTEPLLCLALKTGPRAEGAWAAPLHGLRGDWRGPLSGAQALDLNSTGPERKGCEPPATPRRSGGPEEGGDPEELRNGGRHQSLGEVGDTHEARELGDNGVQGTEPRHCGAGWADSDAPSAEAVDTPWPRG